MAADTIHEERIVSEADCEYVSSRGLMKLCHVRPPFPKSSTRSMYDYDWSLLKPGDIVYVNSSAIPDFRYRIFNKNKITVPFVLVSGDCDETIPFEIFTSDEQFATFINDPRIIHWFGQNVAVKHPKITQIPIGMDYHTLAENKRHEWGPTASPTQQEQLLTAIAKKASPPSERKCLCYANYHFRMNTKLSGDRIEAMACVPKDLVFYEPTPAPRMKSWMIQTQYAFVVSPHGGGLDCHRTWEALALGCYPIVKTSSLDPLFEGLPILITDKWINIKQGVLEDFIKKVSENKDKKYSLDKLYLKYWRDLIYARSASLSITEGK